MRELITFDGALVYRKGIKKSASYRNGAQSISAADHRRIKSACLKEGWSDNGNFDLSRGECCAYISWSTGALIPDLIKEHLKDFPLNPA